jgi:hypothetical protein
LRRVSVLHFESRASKIYDSSNRGPLEVKWRELEFTLLLNSALKFVTLYRQNAVFSRRIAKEKIAVPRTAIVRGPNLRADCHRPEPPAESGGWQSAERLRADCQAVILIVAIHGIRARSLAKH